MNVFNWIVLIATATILFFIYEQGGAFLALLIAACFIPSIALKLRKGVQVSTSLKEQVKFHKDFILFILLFCCWLVGNFIERNLELRVSSIKGMVHKSIPVSGSMHQAKLSLNCARIG